MREGGRMEEMGKKSVIKGVIKGVIRGVIRGEREYRIVCDDHIMLATSHSLQLALFYN